MQTDGVEFDEEKIDMGPLPARPARFSRLYKFSIEDFFAKRGITPQSTKKILIGVIVTNSALTAFIVIKYVVLK